jgi:FliI/YscN family ATPase
MQAIEEQLDSIQPYHLVGRISRLVGMTAAVRDLPAPLGAICRIDGNATSPIEAEVIGFREDETLVLPFDQLLGVRRGDRVSLVESAPTLRVGDRLMGRVMDGRGRFLDGLPNPILPNRVCLHSRRTPPMNRPRIDEPFGTGVRVIDSLLTCGKGQRLGIFSGSGVGKSVLLGQMARSSKSDVNVVVLVGERGREVREFLERDLGPEGLSRSVVIVATSDEPALARIRAAFFGTAVAEYFRETGRDVLLLMDSVTRFALAQREVGLAAGEPPATRGYPPSVFSTLPRLLERCGRSQNGSITGFYTVLVEADDINEPVADTVRGILDGHLMLSRKLAEQAHWPAIDVLASVSRSMNDLVSDQHRSDANQLKKMLAAYEQSSDLITVGAYQPGSSPLVDRTIQNKDQIQRFLQQDCRHKIDYGRAVGELRNLIDNIEK